MAMTFPYIAKARITLEDGTVLRRTIRDTLIADAPTESLVVAQLFESDPDEQRVTHVDLISLELTPR